MSGPAEGGPKAPSPPHPILNAMLIADWAIKEEGSGKTSLIGIFENLYAAKFPCLHSKMCVYTKMTEAEGLYDFRLELIRLDDGIKIAEARANVEAPDRMGAGEIVLDLNNLVFPAPGLYEFRLLANDRFVGSKTFNVLELPPKRKSMARIGG